jgi:tetratricopeptide (TPR) repeat protein
MKYKLWLRGLLSLGLMIGSMPDLQAHPVLFSDYPFDQAKEHAKAEHKLFLIDFTASWCGPCKRMDATTWIDPLVENWIKENAIAIQVDVDQEREIAKKLHVNSMPTIVVFTDSDYNKEFDRESGYKKTGDFLDWLKGVKLGKSSASALEDEASKVIGKGGSAEVQARYNMARHLLNAGKYPEATEQLVWLWRNIPKEDPPMIGVRGSYMVAEMKQIVSQYPDAKPQFDELRSEAEKSDNRSDWVELNGLFGEHDKTLAWFDSVKDKPEQEKTLERIDFILEPILIKNGRWADIGNFLYKDPMKELTKLNELSKEIKQFNRKMAAGLPKEIREHDPFPGKAAVLYTALLAAGREDDAEKVAAESIRLDDSWKLREELVTLPYQQHLSRPAQLHWLEDAQQGTATEAAFYLNRGYVYYKINQFALAVNDYEQALKIGPPNAEVYYDRACALVALKRFPEALDDLNHAISLSPIWAEALMSRGCTEYMLHDDKAALADLERAGQIAPRDAQVFMEKSAVLYRQGKYQEAYDAASHAIEIDPQSLAGYCNRGEASLRLDHSEDALRDLERVISGNFPEGQAEAHYYRALVYDKLGKTELAAQDRAAVDQLGGFKPEGEAPSTTAP